MLDDFVEVGAKAEADATIERMEMALENFMVYIVERSKYNIQSIVLS